MKELLEHRTMLINKIVEATQRGDGTMRLTDALTDLDKLIEKAIIKGEDNAA